MARPSDSELDDVKKHLLLFKAGDTKLPKAQHDATTDAQFADLAADARFSDLPFGVIQYSQNGPPRAFLHKPDENWDIGSGGKLSIAIAALSLLRDVRSMTLAGVIGSSIADSKFNDLLHFVWSRHDEAKIRKLGTDSHFPIPSVMFDVPASQVRFRGMDSIDFADLDRRSGGGHISVAELGRTTVGERLHLTIGQSDNRAARSCQGALGIGFINAVLEKLGLFDVASGNGLRVAGQYGVIAKDLPKGWRQPEAISRAQARASSRPDVDDRPYVANVRALATLMMAIMEDNFLDADISTLFRDLLLLRGGFAMQSEALVGIEAILPANPPPVVTEWGKIGILWSNADFAHIKINDTQFSIIILGLLPKDGINWGLRAQTLGQEIKRKIIP
jgi:hypothetical protein